MPGEEGYPAYLPSRLAEFYERAGLVESLGGQKGSISVIGAVSPPGGDFSEPVTQSTLRVTKVFWALDKGLASRRHFPAISWLDSYSLYTEGLSKWYINNISNLWRKYTSKAMYILQKEQELIEIVRLVGPDALPESDRLILEISKMIREDFLQQSAYHEEDSFCPLEKQFLMLEIILIFYRETKKLLSKGVSISKISELGVKNDIARMKEVAHTKFTEYAKQLKKRIKEECEKLISAV
jgi:V/A-type H+-transporting ATPase subunit A